MTIYISGPMTGLPNLNYDAFYAKEEELTQRGWNVLNPAKVGDLSDYDMYWPIDKAMLDGADAIYMLNGWENSKGALMEYTYAAEKSLSILWEDDALSRAAPYKCTVCKKIATLKHCMFYNTCLKVGRIP